MYYYHQKLSDSNKRIYFNLCSGKGCSVIIWGAVFLKVKTALKP